MVSTVWVTVTSLLGVIIGGTLSLLTQRLAERSAARRHTAEILEGRRAERLAKIIAFIETAQEAERVAISLHTHSASGDAWVKRREAVLDQLWIRVRAVQLLCSDDVSEAAHALAGKLHTVVREGSGDIGITAFIRPARLNLIEVARINLERL
jgi:hypothetical protein